MNPKKRRILIKLLAYRQLCLVGSGMGSSKSYVKQFDFLLAIKHSQMLKDYEILQEKVKQRKLAKEEMKRKAKTTTVPLLGLITSSAMGYQPINAVGDEDFDNDDVTTYLNADEQKLLNFFDQKGNLGVDDANNGVGVEHTDPSANYPFEATDPMLGPVIARRSSTSLLPPPDPWTEEAVAAGIFSRQELQEAAEMLFTLKARTESSLTKHHIASVNLKQWGSANADITEQHPTDGSNKAVLSPHDSDRFTSFRGEVLLSFFIISYCLN